MAKRLRDCGYDLADEWNASLDLSVGLVVPLAMQNPVLVAKLSKNELGSIGMQVFGTFWCLTFRDRCGILYLEVDHNLNRSYLLWITACF